MTKTKKTNHILSTTTTDGTKAAEVVGRRWRHNVAIYDNVSCGEIVTVIVRPAGCGWSMEAEAGHPDTAAAAIAVVAQNPKGL